MTTNSLSLDPALTAQLGDCAVGDEKQITLTVKVTGHDDTGLTGEVTDAQPYDETGADTNPDDTTAATPSKGAPAMQKAMMGQ